MEGRSPKSSPATRGSALRSGLATGLSLMTVSATAGAVGAILAQKFGRTAETDGFLAAYGVYLVLVLAAQSFRLVVVPDLTRAVAEGELGRETRGYLIAFVVLATAVSTLVVVFSHALGEAITGSLPPVSAHVAGRALAFLVPAAFAQLLAAIAVSALAARDEYLVAAIAYAAGGVSGLVLFVLLADAHGTIALAWATVLNGTVTFGIPAVALLWRGDLAGGRGALAVPRRLWRLTQGSAVPIAIQGLYLVCLRLAAGLGVGKVTSFSYAYLIAAVFVAVTAASVALISSAPLTRRGVGVEEAAAHVVHSSWLSVALIAAAAGVFALVGGRVVTTVLGDAFSGHVGRELGRLVVYLSPWMFASVAYTLAFPLAFVFQRTRLLVPLAIAAVGVHLALALALRRAFGLVGIEIALALSTFLVVGALLYSLSPRTLAISFFGLGRLAVLETVLAAASFGVLSVVVGGIPAALAGLALYGLLLGVLRPAGLRDAWAYVRTLH